MPSKKIGLLEGLYKEAVPYVNTYGTEYSEEIVESLMKKEFDLFFADSELWKLYSKVNFLWGGMHSKLSKADNSYIVEKLAVLENFLTKRSLEERVVKGQDIEYDFYIRNEQAAQ